MLEVILRSAAGEKLVSCNAEFYIKRDKGAADLIRLRLRNIRLSDSQDGKRWSFVEVRIDGEEYFGGIVDEQEYVFRGEGSYLTIYGRSYAALLIDNEMRPCTVKNPTVRFLSEAYFKPLGFDVVGEADSLGEIIVEKKTSLYRFIEIYCRKFLGTEPLIRGRKIYLDSRYPERTVKIAEPEEISVIAKPCKVYSDIYIKNPCSGAYSVRRSGSAELGYRRVRYTDKLEKAEGRIMDYIRVKKRGSLNIYPMDAAETDSLIFMVDSVKIRGDEGEIIWEAGGYKCG